MNFTALIQGFCSYLEDLNQISDKDYNIQNAKASIFMYSNEFKSYLANELKTDVKIESMSVNDILKMDIVNGKLVEGEDIPSTDDNIPSDEQQEQPSVPENPDNEEYIQPTDGSQDNNVQVTDIINNFLENDEVKGVVDDDGDGNISQEEMTAFIDKVNSFDNDSTNFSVDDLMAAAQAIQDGTFDSGTSIEKPSDETEKIEPTEGTETIEKPDTGTEKVPEQDKSEGKKSHSSHSSDNDYSSENNGDDVKEKSLDNMTKEELNAELTKAESTLDEKQQNLSAIIDGTSSEIKALEDSAEEAYKTYHDELAKVDEDMAKQLDTYKDDVSKKEQEISKKEQDISKQEIVVSDCENSYNNAVSNRENLESILTGLKDAKSTAAEDQVADINDKISQVEAQLADAKEAESTAKDKWDEEKANLETLNKEKDELKTGENGLDELNKQLSDYEAEIAAKYPQIDTYKQAWDEAKNLAATSKETAAAKAKEDVAKAQEEVNKVKTAIQNYDNKENEKTYSADPKNLYDAELGAQLAQIANNTDGTIGYCLRGVAKSVKKFLGERTELSNLGSAYMAANALRNDPVLSQHFKEVEVDRSELSSLPAGAIVVWDRGAPNASAAGKKHGHISIALGNGKESSDHIQNQMTNRQSQFWVFYPVAA
jgi:hypothetical protein